MNKLTKGIIEAISAIVMGFALTTFVTTFARNGILPGYSVWLFGLVSIIGNLATINSFSHRGVVYVIGWLAGALLLRDMLTPLDVAFNIIAPVLVLMLQVGFWTTKGFRRKRRARH